MISCRLKMFSARSQFHSKRIMLVVRGYGIPFVLEVCVIALTCYTQIYTTSAPPNACFAAVVVQPERL